jgi:hypothetical protein
MLLCPATSSTFCISIETRRNGEAGMSAGMMSRRARSPLTGFDHRASSSALAVSASASTRRRSRASSHRHHGLLGPSRAAAITRVTGRPPPRCPPRQLGRTRLRRDGSARAPTQGASAANATARSWPSSSAVLFGEESSWRSRPRTSRSGREGRADGAGAGVGEEGDPLLDECCPGLLGPGFQGNRGERPCALGDGPPGAKVINSPTKSSERTSEGDPWASPIGVGRVSQRSSP